MPLKKKPLFRRGYVGGWTEEERLFALDLLKNFKLKDFKGQEQRMLRRLVMRFMGVRMHSFPLHIPKECPHCERMLAASYERHVLVCKQKQETITRLPPIDPAVLEMI